MALLSSTLQGLGTRYDTGLTYKSTFFNAGVADPKKGNNDPAAIPAIPVNSVLLISNIANRFHSYNNLRIINNSAAAGGNGAVLTFGLYLADEQTPSSLTEVSATPIGGNITAVTLAANVAANSSIDYPVRIDRVDLVKNYGDLPALAVIMPYVLSLINYQSLVDLAQIVNNIPDASIDTAAHYQAAFDAALAIPMVESNIQNQVIYFTMRAPGWNPYEITRVEILAQYNVQKTAVRNAFNTDAATTKAAVQALYAATIAPMTAARNFQSMFYKMYEYYLGNDNTFLGKLYLGFSVTTAAIPASFRFRLDGFDVNASA